MADSGDTGDYRDEAGCQVKHESQPVARPYQLPRNANEGRLRNASNSLIP
jgi:hypothetical protein